MWKHGALHEKSERGVEGWQALKQRIVPRILVAIAVRSGKVNKEDIGFQRKPRAFSNRFHISRCSASTMFLYSAALRYVKDTVICSSMLEDFSWNAGRRRSE